MYALFRVAIMTNKLYSMYLKMGQSMPNGAMLPTIEFVAALLLNATFVAVHVFALHVCKPDPAVAEMV